MHLNHPSLPPTHIAIHVHVLMEPTFYYNIHTIMNPESNLQIVDIYLNVNIEYERNGNFQFRIYTISFSLNTPSGFGVQSITIITKHRDNQLFKISANIVFLHEQYICKCQLFHLVSK